jgi:hypothetical protein
MKHGEICILHFDLEIFAMKLAGTLLAKMG